MELVEPRGTYNRCQGGAYRSFVQPSDSREIHGGWLEAGDRKASESIGASGLKLVTTVSSFPSFFFRILRQLGDILSVVSDWSCISLVSECRESHGGTRM